ncbi:hypothetical protein EDC01DRAFT_677162 [Geopyxis carbonaria]|nr:hypothetical protein EDC01DRAFT_677162 [Geopyxis carbonaria]
MSSTPQLPITPAYRAFFQRVINLYHRRLLAAWKSVTGGAEAVPASHVAPPSIADWPHDKIEKVLDNYKLHMYWFRVDDETWNLHLEHYEMVLLRNAFYLLPHSTTSHWTASEDFKKYLLGKSENILASWERFRFPALKPDWDQFRMEDGRAEDENKPAGCGNRTEVTLE